MPTLNGRILLIEDEANDALLTKMALEGAGVRTPVTVVENGRDALAYFGGTDRYSDRKKYPLPYLVLLDLKLPYVMGIEVLKWMRERPEFDSTVVIVLTSSSSHTDVATAYRCGANAYLIKPNSFDQLKDMARAIDHFWFKHNEPGTSFSEP